MNEPQAAKKKSGKKKKKSSTNQDGNIAEGAIPPTAENEKCNIKEILPQKVGWTTVINEMEVTMTQSNPDNAPAQKKSKKKKKKTSKQSSSSEAVEEPSINENENSPNLLNFTDSGIKLVNHPEISVTVTEGQQKNDANANADAMPTADDPAEVSADASAPKKKKKKKKKKKNDSQTDPVPTTVAAEDPTQTAPTYIKLPATGDTCVLVVSHESFANGNATDKTKVSANNMVSVINTIQNGKLSSERGIPETSSLSTLDSKTDNSATLIQGSLPVELGETTKTDAFSNLNTESKAAVQNSIVKITEKQEANEDESKLTKSQLKAERRAKQEAQRAAKLAKNAEKISINKQPPVDPAKANLGSKENSIPPTSSLKVAEPKRKDFSKVCLDRDQPSQIRLFSHLPQYKMLDLLPMQLSKTESKIHPAVLEIGTQFARGIICGSNARCIALLAAFREVIMDYTKPVDKEFSRDLKSMLKFHMNFLDNCRPLSVSMVNAVKFLNHQINHVKKDLSDEDIKEELCIFLKKFVKEEILLAKQQIGTCAVAKIVDGDVILVFAYSSLVKEVLCKAFTGGKKFRVIVVDSRPKLEALKMINCLIEEGIPCTYTLINSVSYAMKGASKVIIGAHALLANGYVMSRVGCSQIALVASTYSVPVLVCCETYKFCDRVLTDSFVYNELGDPEILVNTGLKNEVLKSWQDLPSLQLLNLLYDVTPPDFISMVITEKGVLPCTSVPVVLRVRHAGLRE